MTANQADSTQLGAHQLSLVLVGHRSSLGAGVCVHSAPVRTAPPAVRPDHTVRCAETTSPTHPRLPFLSGKRVPAPPPAEVAGRPGGLTAAVRGCMVRYTCR
jgi:hypothetical protein